MMGRLAVSWLRFRLCWEINGRIRTIDNTKTSSIKRLLTRLKHRLNKDY